MKGGIEMNDAKNAFSENDALTLNIINSEKLETDQSYVSQIESAFNNSTIIIHNPIVLGHLVPFNNGVELSIYLVSRDAIYNFTGRVVKTFIRDISNLIEIKISSEIKRIQRRDFFRYKTPLELTLTDLGKFESSDVSGGGIGFCSKVEVQLKTKINGYIKMPKENIKFNGTIVRCEKNDKGYSIGVRFDKLENESRELIVKYITAKQLSDRKAKLSKSC